MPRRLTVIVVVILGILAAVQVEAEAQVPQTIGVLPSVHVGNGPQGAAFDRATDTVYVANQGDNTVSVVDARHCNSLDTSGCAQTPATAPTGAGPFAIAIDDATHTVYVANQNDGTVSVIDAATCNGQNQSGCADAGPTIAAGPTPFGIAVDRRTDTVYVTDLGDDAGTVSVIDLSLHRQQLAGVVLIKRIRAYDSAARTLVFSMRSDRSSFFAAIEAGTWKASDVATITASRSGSASMAA